MGTPFSWFRFYILRGNSGFVFHSRREENGKMGFSRVWNLGVFENFDSIELNEGRDVSYDLPRFF